MPGDEEQEGAAAATGATAKAGRARTGPRHAAPKKPLLTRLHVPAGKAIAMAAMPSAVLMGLGFTPQLANAKPLPKNPFREGPCVSAPDREETRDESGKVEKDGAGRDGKEPGKEATASPDATASPLPSRSATPGDDAESGKPEGSGSRPPAEESRDPLDPLGVGDLLEDLLTPKEKEQRAEAAQPSPSASGRTGGDDPVGDAVDGVGKGVGDVVDGLEKGVEDAKDKLPTPSPSGSGDKDEDAAADEDGKKPFPCVEGETVAGEHEQTPGVLADHPWQLEASAIAMHGLDYKGVVNVRTANGTVKQVLKFTANSVDITDLHQIVPGNGVRYHVRSDQGSTSTIRGGMVTMYTERLEGKLFGLIPIVFDPQHQPPLNLPEVYFTDVKVQQAGQFGGDLTVPGLRSSIE